MGTNTPNLSLYKPSKTSEFVDESILATQYDVLDSNVPKYVGKQIALPGGVISDVAGTIIQVPGFKPATSYHVRLTFWVNTTSTSQGVSVFLFGNHSPDFNYLASTYFAGANVSEFTIPPGNGITITFVNGKKFVTVETVLNSLSSGQITVELYTTWAGGIPASSLFLQAW